MDVFSIHVPTISAFILSFLQKRRIRQRRLLASAVAMMNMEIAAIIPTLLHDQKGLTPTPNVIIDPYILLFIPMAVYFYSDALYFASDFEKVLLVFFTGFGLKHLSHSYFGFIENSSVFNEQNALLISEIALLTVFLIMFLSTWTNQHLTSINNQIHNSSTLESRMKIAVFFIWVVIILTCGALPVASKCLGDYDRVS